jgi:hypothetical protein
VSFCSQSSYFGAKLKNTKPKSTIDIAMSFATEKRLLAPEKAE